MTINDIKPGYLVQLKNGDFYLVVQTASELALVQKPFKDSSLWCSLHLRTFGKNDELSIMKVYGFSRYANTSLSFTTRGRELLWEYKPEKKKYTYAQIREILGEEFEVVSE